VPYGAPVRQLFPTPAEIDPDDAHESILRPAPPERPWVALNTIASVDGATAVDGVSGPLGTPADRAVFGALRAIADVVVAGASTVTAERYRSPRTSAARQERRLARGQRRHPRLAVVSASLEFPLDLDLFTDPAERPLVLTTADADPDRLAAVSRVADVVRAGTGQVDLAAALGHLRAEASAELVLCEGGSTLNGHLAAAGLIDELNVSLAPTLVAGASPRLASGPVDHPRPLRLAHLWEADHLLLARYEVVRPD
jgi:riboflavin biosynthesis pyrimidine reductase